MSNLKNWSSRLFSQINITRRDELHVYKNSVFTFFFYYMGARNPALVILDQSVNGDGRKSVTNNMENVLLYISQITGYDLSDFPICYRDTELTFDEVLARSTRFDMMRETDIMNYDVSFRSINERCSWEKAAKVVHYRRNNLSNYAKIKNHESRRN